MARRVEIKNPGGEWELQSYPVAKRDNAGKPMMAYAFLFPKALEALARVMEFGAAKYGDGNWQQGGKPDREYLDANCRHITKAMNNDSPYDEESRCLHYAHALWNIMALIELNHEGDVIADDFADACEAAQQKRDGCESPKTVTYWQGKPVPKDRES